jgi:hypothetical protein
VGFDSSVWGPREPLQIEQIPCLSSEYKSHTTFPRSNRLLLNTTLFVKQSANTRLSLTIMAPGGPPGGARGRGGKFKKFTRGGKLREYSPMALYPLTHLQVVNTSHGICDHSMPMETKSPKKTPTHQLPRRRTPKRRVRPRRRRRRKSRP